MNPKKFERSKQQMPKTIIKIHQAKPKFGETRDFQPIPTKETRYYAWPAWQQSPDPSDLPMPPKAWLKASTNRE